MKNINLSQNNHETSIGLFDNKGSLLTLFISYETLVAFRYKGSIYCIQNYWSTTTGKFLNKIEPDHKLRLSMEDFNTALSKVKLNIL